MSQDNQVPGAGSSPRGEPALLLPGGVTALAGLMIAIQLAQSLVLSAEAQQLLVYWFGFIPLRALVPGGFEGGAWPLLWTPLTHAFLHAGWEHALVNVAWLVIFATPVARRYGTVPLYIVFLASSVVGALAFAATTWGDLQLLIGASGGVAGLTGAAVRFMFQPILVTTNPETGERILLGRRLARLREVLTERRARTFALFWVVVNAAVPLFPLLTGSPVQIAWQAHLGGFFTGLLIVPLFERRHVQAA